MGALSSTAACFVYCALPCVTETALPRTQLFRKLSLPHSPILLASQHEQQPSSRFPTPQELQSLRQLVQHQDLQLESLRKQAQVQELQLGSLRQQAQVRGEEVGSLRQQVQHQQQELGQLRAKLARRDAALKDVQRDCGQPLTEPPACLPLLLPPSCHQSQFRLSNCSGKAKFASCASKVTVAAGAYWQAAEKLEEWVENLAATNSSNRELLEGYEARAAEIPFATAADLVMCFGCGEV